MTNLWVVIKQGTPQTPQSSENKESGIPAFALSLPPTTDQESGV